ncbi:hypothetical protein Tco_1277639 [Tanacetum coccineum]
MFDIDYLTDSMNYIPVSLENQANPHAGSSEVTNCAGTSQTPNANASKETDEDAELIVVPSAVKNTEEKVKTRKSSTNSKKEEILTEPQQEKEASSTDTSEDNPKILAFRRKLEEIALKHNCDYYEKKMAREAEFKKQRVFNTGNRVAKPVWTNPDKINHANQFVPRPVQLNTGRPNINYVRPNINTGRTNINSVRPRVNTVNSNVNTVRSRQPVPTRTSNSFSPKRPQVNQFNQRRHFSKSHSSVRRPFAKNTAQMSHSHAVKENWGSAVKTSAGYNWRTTRPNSNCNGGPTFIRTDHPLKNMVDRGIFDSGCSGHMTGNKDQLEDFEEFNGGSVTFGGSKGYITSKGRIRVGNC